MKKLEIRVEFKPNRESDERWIKAYEMVVPSRSFNVGSELIFAAKRTKPAKSVKKQQVAA